jgi:hypothetical protein
MSYLLTDTEFNAALQLNADYRYQHFFSKIKKNLVVYVLRKEQEILFLESTDEDSENNILPVWCHEDYAAKYTENNETCEKYTPQAISLAIFLEKWIPTMASSNGELAIFPTTNSDCTIISAAEFEKEFN